MKKILFLFLLTINVICSAQIRDVIIVSPIQYDAMLKRDSIINSNKVKSKTFTIKPYHGPKNFINPIPVNPIDTVKNKNKNLSKPNYYPFYHKTNYVHTNKTFTFDIPYTRIMTDTINNIQSENQRLKEAKRIEIENLKIAKEEERKRKYESLQSLKEAKRIENENLKIAKEKEQKNKAKKHQKLKDDKAKYNEKLKKSQQKKKNKLIQKNKKRK